MKELTCLCLVLLSFSTKGQNIFQRTIGHNGTEYAFMVKPTDDGGTILVGETTSFGSGGTDVYVVRTDNNANILWTKTYGGSDADHGYDIIQSADNGFIIIGDTKSFGNGKTDMYILKIDSAGNTSWARTVGGSGDDGAGTIKYLSGGYYLVTGTIESASPQEPNIALVTISETGVVTNLQTISGLGLGWAASATFDQGHVISGFTSSSGAGGLDICLVKFNPGGGIAWAKTYGGAKDDIAYGMQQTLDGGYIVSGFTQSFGSLGWNNYLLKTDATGNLLWSKVFTGSNNDRARHVIQTQDSGYLLAGYGPNAGNLIKTNSSGSIEWSKSFIQGSALFSVTETLNGYFAAGGITDNTGSSDVYLLKLNKSGTSGCQESTISLTTSDPSSVVSTFSPGFQLSSVNSVPANVDTNSGGIMKTICLNGVGVHTIDNMKPPVLLYPNPGYGIYTIVRCPNCYVEVYDGVGKIVFDAVSEDVRNEIDIRSFANGVYFYRIKDLATGYTSNGKLIKN